MDDKKKQTGRQQASVEDIAACSADLKTVLRLEKWLKLQPKSQVSKRLHENIQRWLNEANSANVEPVQVENPEARLRKTVEAIRTQDKFENDLEFDESVPVNLSYPIRSGLSLGGCWGKRTPKKGWFSR
jgi:hypothetical protein